MEREELVIKSNTNKTLLTSGIISLVGLWFVWLTSGKIHYSENYLAAYWLGLLLLFLGVAAILLNHEITLIFDIKNQKLIYHTKNIYEAKRQLVPFSDILQTKIARIGRPSTNTETFHLNLLLKSGRTLSTGRWSFDAIEMFEVATQIDQALGHQSNKEPHVETQTSASQDFQNLILALFLTVGEYLLYYRLKIGPFCPGMWIGSFPVLFILFFSLINFKIIKRILS